jgi:hypothetical protein
MGVGILAALTSASDEVVDTDDVVKTFAATKALRS